MGSRDPSFVVIAPLQVFFKISVCQERVKSLQLQKMKWWWKCSRLCLYLVSNFPLLLRTFPSSPTKPHCCPKGRTLNELATGPTGICFMPSWFLLHGAPLLIVSFYLPRSHVISKSVSHVFARLCPELGNWEIKAPPPPPKKQQNCIVEDGHGPCDCQSLSYWLDSSGFLLQDCLEGSGSIT